MSKKNTILFILVLITSLSSPVSYAVASDSQNAGVLADNVVSILDSVSGLVMAIAYICAIGYGLSAIMKIKQHRDNPQQMPLSTPITELIIALALAFFPSILAISGNTIFGNNSQFANPGGTPEATRVNERGLPVVGSGTAAGQTSQYQGFINPAPPANNPMQNAPQQYISPPPPVAVNPNGEALQPPPGHYPEPPPVQQPPRNIPPPSYYGAPNN